MTQDMRPSRERFRDGEEEQAPKKVKKPGRRKWILIPLILVVLAAGFVAYAYFTQSLMFAPAEGAPVDEKIYNMDSFVLNLNEETGRRYIKTQLVLAYESDKDVKVFDEHIAQIRDRIIAILRVKTPKEMMDVSTVETLKTQIKDGVNGLLTEPLVLNVYFVDFMIQ